MKLQPKLQTKRSPYYEGSNSLGARMRTHVFRQMRQFPMLIRRALSTTIPYGTLQLPMNLRYPITRHEPMFVSFPPMSFLEFSCLHTLPPSPHFHGCFAIPRYSTTPVTHLPRPLGLSESNQTPSNIGFQSHSLSYIKKI